jgi:uncharacterized membrane protein YfcA
VGEDGGNLPPADRLTTRTGKAGSVAYGSLTGFLAGLVGLGGAEPRIPFILYYLKLSLEEMIVVNLIISLATSSFNLAARANAGLWSGDAALVSVAMVAGSLPGKYAGASISYRVSRRALKAFIAMVLTLVVVRVVYGLLVPGSGNGSIAPPLELALSLATGFGVGIVSGSVGVAGGEYRIPILTYLLGFPIKIAGTVSQLVTLPTMVVGIWKHRRQGSFTRRSIRASVILGVPSVGGAILSGFLAVSIPATYIEVLFALILSYTVAALSWEVAGKGRVETGTKA